MPGGDSYVVEAVATRELRARGWPARSRTRRPEVLRSVPGPCPSRSHAYSVQDAYIYGFALQEKTLGFETRDDAGKAVQRRAEAIGALADYPYLAEIAATLPESGYDPAVEFAWGLDLILDGLDRLRPRG
jgi:Tetracyclin repressor-like, C-terminal domain